MIYPFAIQVLRRLATARAGQLISKLTLLPLVRAILRLSSPIPRVAKKKWVMTGIDLSDWTLCPFMSLLACEMIESGWFHCRQLLNFRTISYHFVHAMWFEFMFETNHSYNDYDLRTFLQSMEVWKLQSGLVKKMLFTAQWVLLIDNRTVTLTCKGS